MILFIVLRMDYYLMIVSCSDKLKKIMKYLEKGVKVGKD